MTETTPTPTAQSTPAAEAGKEAQKQAGNEAGTATTTPAPAVAATPIVASTTAEQTAKKEKESEKSSTLSELRSSESSHPVRPEVRPHAFVVMPFGKKKGGDGSLYDFNAIYKELIKPALEEAGFEPFRADEETSSGDILTDMFQELLLADLCLCDLSIDNANVYYELGIRHAFRKRGVVHIQAGRAYMPFDIFNVRTLPYHITPEGVPDPQYIKADIKAIARMTRDTWASDRDAIHSPIFNLLTGLREPERTALRTPLATGFWREYNEWRNKVTVAQRQKRIGDILLLTEEIQNPLIKEEAIGEAGRALSDMGRNELALAQYRKGLEVNSSNLNFRRQEAFNLNRMGRVDEAIVKIESLLNDFPNDSEAIAYLGRIYKEMWVGSWKNINDKNKRIKNAFETYHWLIRAVDIYLRGYHIDLNNNYPGINAFTLSIIAVHLADKFDDPKDPDPDITRIRQNLPELRGSLIFGLENITDDDRADYWTLISLAELRVLTADNVSAVARAYRKAITASRRNLFFLNSSLSQLEILKALGLREEFVQVGIDTLKDEIMRTSGDDASHSTSKKGRSKKTKTDARAFLFTGYMVDYPAKEKKTFPPERENEIRQEIIRKLEKFKITPDDRAFVGGLSAGSEILFAEVCAEKGIKVKAFLPLPESAYIRKFVSPAGDNWVDRFHKIRNHPLVDEMYQIEHVGLPKEGDDPYERNNRWALYSSLGKGIDKVYLIALWNAHGDKPKDLDARLVHHMIELMRDTGGSIEQINTSKYLHSVIDNVLGRLMDEQESGKAKSNATKVRKLSDSKK
ncbi:MAG TPA: TRAFs-binding domain-containing protein [Anaerolineales bacterium]|nr:TRAFs-binding domain-containing protein [Anaerolineales bacterium]HNH04932.1 TRAFs-binding domain-containing protein [Anaerolineales bacterium]